MRSHRISNPPTFPDDVRYTIDGDEALERHINLSCTRVLSGVQGIVPAAKLECVLLGGGYGRGEGGVLSQTTGDRPYNDLEFYVAINGNRHLNETRYARPLQVLGEILTHLADVEVEFKITSLAELKVLPVSMFSYDLLSGHRILFGNASQLAGLAHHRKAEDIPSSEGIRLLMNRFTGLLLAKAKLQRTPLPPSSADFVRRNIAKSQLACGDAFLTFRGLYHWSCRERHRRLQTLAEAGLSPWFDAMVEHHRAGMEFKLHPTSGDEDPRTLEHDHAAASMLGLDTWLWLEGRRLQRSFPDVRAYLHDPTPKWPDPRPIRNALLNFRAIGLRPPVMRRLFRHPRERVMNALSVLLWEPESLGDPAARARIGSEIGRHADTFHGSVAAYQALWLKVR